ncbi:protein phosphatase 2C domain-containing protein [Streptomyces sp. SPB162]|uniref:protein phosphatase 2C domain-containing protein n=1 Tax=Streptomyces sp. SPB162 TaxID=2940560 RepID=UPI002407476F|nr:protein phosphatase 2C domain-containing protein [Streptomyces sp. SPB162]MDF9815596.1 hypothetical protein [Streptomyces sp. SPB162]
MRIESSTEPGTPNRPNEDFLALALPASGQGGALVLLDGVTPAPGNGDCVHSVPWFVARLGGALLELSVSRSEMTLADCLATAIRRTADAHRDTCDLSHRLTPQATVVTVRWNQDSVEHLVLSDSALLLEAPDGKVTPVLDGRIERLVAEGRAVSALRNSEGGFFTAAADPAVVSRAVTGTTPRADVRAFAALTDGASRLVEVFRTDDWAGTFALLREEGPQTLIRRVRATESADPEGRDVPRGKPFDDATAALVEL